MATTYELTFDYNLALFKLTAKKKYGDSTRSDVSYLIDLAQKLGKLSLASGTPPASAGGANAAHVHQYDVVGAGTATIDLTALDLIDERTAQSLARYKFLFFWLLPTAKGGSAASGVTVGNAATNAHQLFLGGDTMTFTLGNDDWIASKVGAAAGKVVDATNKSVLVTNNDAGVTASLLVAIAGGLT
jgi:hypothetical protein